MQSFHKCLSLIDDPDIESKVDLGIPIEEKYTRVRFRYADVTDYLEWVEEDEHSSDETIKGTIVYTVMGRVYFITTPLNDFDLAIDKWEEQDRDIWPRIMN